LERLPGGKRAQVSLEKAEARVDFDDAKISAEKLVAAIDRLGFQAKLVSVTLE
jgi:copper chaperone CopZ